MHFDQRSWEAVMYTLSDFENSSGMRVNYDKTTVYRIGSIKDSDANFYSAKKIKWTNEPINILGVWVVHTDQQNFERNIQPLMQKAKAVLELWHHRNMSLFGKILVINALVASFFVYRFSVLRTLPRFYVKDIKTIFSDFIWNQKKPKITYLVLEGLKTDGGAQD